MKQFALTNTEGDLSSQSCRMQANSFLMRIWGPWDGEHLSTDEWEAVAKVSAACFGPKEALHSLPNGNESDAVRQAAKDKVVRLFPGVQRGGQVVPGNAVLRGSSTGSLGEDSLHLTDILRGDPLCLPEINGLPRELEVLGELLGRDNPLLLRCKRPRQGREVVGGFHPNLVPQDLPQGKCHLLEAPTGSRDPMDMADIPRPELFSSLKAWLNASLQVPGVTQQKIADFCGVKRQAVGLWAKGRDVKPHNLKKLAQWGNADYLVLRGLADGEPLTTTRKSRAEKLLRRDPEVEQLASLLDSLAGNKSALKMARVLIHQLVMEHTEETKRARAKNE